MKPALYSAGEHTGTTVEVRVGDALTVMKTLPDASQELIFTSPPYNIHEPNIGGSFPKNFGSWQANTLEDGYPTHSDDLPYEEYRDWQRECVAEMWRILAPNGAIFFNHKPRIKKGKLWHPMELVPDHVPIRQCLIWYRNAGMNFNARAFLNVHEYILVLAKPEFRMAEGQRGNHDVWSVAPDYGNKHPAPFPVALPARAIEATGLKSVFDPFLGSGTTGVAAVEAGCASFLGIELFDDYAKSAEERILSAKRLPPQAPVKKRVYKRASK